MFPHYYGAPSQPTIGQTTPTYLDEQAAMPLTQPITRCEHDKAKDSQQNKSCFEIRIALTLKDLKIQ